MAACPLYCKAVATFVCFEVCFQESLTPTHFLLGLVESGAEQGQCKWEKWIKELCPSPVVLLLLLPLLPRNINCMQGKWRMSTAERSMGAKILSCSSGQNVSASSVKLLLRLLRKALSFKHKGLVVSGQSRSPFVYDGTCPGFCCLMAPCLCAFAAAGFQNGWQSPVCSRASVVFFHFLSSEQIENKAFTCNTKQLFFFFTAGEGKRFWKEEGPMWRFMSLIFCNCPN